MYVNNPHLRYVNPNSTGYFVLDLTVLRRIMCRLLATDLSGLISPKLTLLGTWCTKVNENHLCVVSMGPLIPPAPLPI